LEGKHLHIIAFDVPYPADYGGVIDVFYKIKTLWKAGINIHLHCFLYGKRKPHTELNRYCTEVNYYKRKTGLFSFFSPVPYIIKSRMSRELEERLLKDDHPVLCEGIHTCGILRNSALLKRKILFRPANVEHNYYAGLARLEKNLFRKVYFFLEARKLKRWEDQLEHVSEIFPISDADGKYFRDRFPGISVTVLYGFHPYDDVDILPGRGEYILFHGNLAVPDNLKAARFILEKIVPAVEMPVVIAGKDPPEGLVRKIKATPGARLVENPGAEEMERLVREAHIHLLLTFQRAGLKLKLLIALFRGRHIIANRDMMTLEGVDGCIEIAKESREIMESIREWQGVDFTTQDMELRKKCVSPELINEENGKKFIGKIY